MKRSVTVFSAALLLAASAGVARAHHSFSMFDNLTTQTMSGVVKSLDIVNPHSWLNIVVARPGGQVEWALEMGGPGQLQAQGWSSATVKPGDTITVRMHPLRDGSNGGQLVSATLADGKTMVAQPPGRGGGQ
ncbi:MAG: DUF6152 family protein [Alphaproteobacteria bacterium]